MTPNSNQKILKEIKDLEDLIVDPNGDKLSSDVLLNMTTLMYNTFEQYLRYSDCSNRVELSVLLNHIHTIKLSLLQTL